MAVTQDPQYPSLIIYPGKLWKQISKKVRGFRGVESNCTINAMEDSLAMLP